tara:strand:+ start:1044 stop:1163 length:120 start_codon:yes stop_codon:yes gene_type:complete
MIEVETVIAVGTMIEVETVTEIDIFSIAYLMKTETIFLY